MRWRAAPLALSALALLRGGGDPVAASWDVHRAGPGLEWAERPLADSETGSPTRLVVVWIDPARYRFSLAAAVSAGGTQPEWSIDRAPPSAGVAINAGQFAGASPWGWVVHQGIEARPPGVGPLSSAVVFGKDGRLRLVDADALEDVRDSGVAAEAIQSYPTLLHGSGEVPLALRRPGRGVDLTHRDSRLAVGITHDGRLVIALTHFDGLGGTLPSAPWGPTIPEMVAIMRRLGCVRAVSLDGGLSSQLLVRDSAGVVRSWHGWRAVPMGLFAEPG